MVRKTPLWSAGTPNNVKSPCALQADPCCRRAITVSRRSRGSGTIPNRKSSGNSADREARKPNETTKLPIHASTRANIAIESCTSDPIRVVQTRIQRSIATATIRSPTPGRMANAVMPESDRRSRRSSAALTGRMRRIYVYSSLCSDNEKVSTNDRQHIRSDAAHRAKKNVRCRCRSVIAFSVIEFSSRAHSCAIQFIDKLAILVPCECQDSSLRPFPGYPPLSALSHDRHPAACPPPAIDIARKGKPDVFTFAQVYQQAKQILIDLYCAWLIQVIRVNENGCQAISGQNNFKLELPQIDRPCIQDM